MAALPWTEVAGDDQYVRSLFLWGQQDLALSGFRIGTTPIGAFDDVETETVETPNASSLYPSNVSQEPLAVDLNVQFAWQERRTEGDCTAIGGIIDFPNGLAFISDEGRRDPIYASFAIQYRPAGSAGDWTPAPSVEITAGQTSALRRHFYFGVPFLAEGYDVRVQRFAVHPEPRPDSVVLQDAFWTALQTYRTGVPIARAGRKATATRIRATGQLNGTLDELNGLAQSITPVWNGSDWTDQGPTSNPAYLYRWLLTGPANADARPEAEMDDERFAEWASYCATEGFTFDRVIDYKTSIPEVLAQIAAAGRAAPSRRDGKWSVVIDQQAGDAVQMFTPKNSWGYSWRKSFDRVPHALRVKFRNAANDYSEAERIVYRDGYSAANATDIEGLELAGITSADLAWRHGRYHLASLILRPREHRFSADWEHLVCHRGDPIKLQHYVVKVGLGSARVKSVHTDGNGDVDRLVLDQPITMELGKEYAVEVRTEDLISSYHPIETTVGETATVTFLTPVSPSRGIAVGDLVAFGEVERVTIDLVIREINKGDNESATLVCLDRSLEIHDADKGVIPPFDPGTTTTPGTVTPVISGFQSNERVAVRMAGAVQVRMVVTFGFVPVRSGRILYDLQVQLREKGAVIWRDAAFITPDTIQASLEGVEQGVTYQVRARYRYDVGAFAGPWSGAYEHTVIGLSTLPPDVETLVRDVNTLSWTYDPPIDFAGFQVRYHLGRNRHWASGTLLQAPLLQASEVSVDRLPPGLVTVMVKARDIANNESANAAVAVLDLGDPLVENIVETIDYRAAGYPGTIVGGSVVGSEIVATETSLTWVGDDAASAWKPDPTTLTWNTAYLGLSYTAAFVPDQDWVDQAAITLTADVVGADYRIEYRPGGSAPMWLDDNATFWSGNDSDTFWQPLGAFRSWPGRLKPVSRQRYEIRAVVGADAIQGKVRAFAVVADLPDQEERFDDVAIGAGGTRLPITKSYREIKNVSLTLQQVPGLTATSAFISDKDASLGPLIICANGDGSTAGVVDAIIQGVPL